MQRLGRTMTAEEPTVRLDRIAERMKVLGIESDRELARRADIDNVTVSLLRGGNRPNIGALMLARIARALRCSTSYLLGESDLLNGPGVKMPPSGEEMIELMNDLPDDRNAELVGVGRVMAEAERKRAEVEAEVQRLIEYIRRTGDPVDTERRLELVHAAVLRRDYAAARMALYSMLGDEGAPTNGTINGPLAQDG